MRKIRVIKIEKYLLIVTIISLSIPLIKDIGVIEIAVFNIPLFFLVSLWFIRMLLVKKHEFKLDLWDLSLILLGFWMLLSSAFILDTAMSRIFIWESAILLGMYSKHNYNITFNFKDLFRVFLFILLIQIVISILQLITFSSIGNIGAYFGEKSATDPVLVKGEVIRLVGTLGQPNLLCSLLIILLPFIYQLLIKDNGSFTLKQLFSISIYFSVLIIIFLSSSRMNLIISLSIPIIFWFIKTLGREGLLLSNVIKKILISFGFLIGLYLIIIFFDDFLLVRYNSYFSSLFERYNEISDSADNRLTQYVWAIKSIFQNPIFGVGYSNSFTIWKDIDAPLPSDFIYKPHSLYLIIATEGGIPSLLFFTFAVAIPYFRYLKSLKRVLIENHVYAISILMYLLVGLTYVFPVEHVLWPLFMLLLGSFTKVSKESI